MSRDPMYVYFDLDEQTLLRIRRLCADGTIKSRWAGGHLPIMAGLADGDEFPYRSIIDFIDNHVDPTSHTVSARGTIANPGPGAIVSGGFLKVRLPIGPPRRALLVPEEAVMSRGGERWVYVVDRDGAVTRRPVAVGPLRDGLRAIDDGLSGDEPVIVSGLQHIRPGEVVLAQEELLAPPSVTGGHLGGEWPRPSSDRRSPHAEGFQSSKVDELRRPDSPKDRSVSGSG